MTHGWHTLGKFRVLAMPLFDNPAFTTHRIFLGDKLIGKQLSVPSLSDCEWFAVRRGQYASPAESATLKSYRDRQTIHRRRGRTRKEDSERELAEAMQS